MKICMIFLVILSVLTLLSAEGILPAGSGTEADPYLIETLDNLLYLSTNSSLWYSGTYILQTADIDAAATTGWNNGNGFIPIGNQYDFEGNYNGQGYVIDNL